MPLMHTASVPRLREHVHTRTQQKKWQRNCVNLLSGVLGRMAQPIAMRAHILALPKALSGVRPRVHPAVWARSQLHLSLMALTLRPGLCPGYAPAR